MSQMLCGLLVATVLAVVAGGCVTDDDCALNGLCQQGALHRVIAVSPPYFSIKLKKLLSILVHFTSSTAPDQFLNRAMQEHATATKAGRAIIVRPLTCYQ